MTAAIHQQSMRLGRKPIKDWQRTPAEEASYQAMLAKCKKWSEPPPIEKPAPEEVVAEQILKPQLCWNRRSDAEWVSVCRRYEITLESAGGYRRDSGLVVVAGRQVFQCWKQVPQLWYIRLDAHVLSFEEAQARCEQHLRDAA